MKNHVRHFLIPLCLIALHANATTLESNPEPSTPVASPAPLSPAAEITSPAVASPPLAPSIDPQSSAEIRNMAVAPEAPVSLSRPNALGVELLGRALIYSLTYDRSLTSWMAIGAGASFLGVTVGLAGAGVLIFPVYANFYLLPDSHRPFITLGTDFLIGMASYYWSESSNGSAVGFSGFNNAQFGIGYEYRGKSGFLFRVSPYLAMATYGGRLLMTGTIGLTFGGIF